MARALFEITPVDVTPGTLNSWQDVDGKANGVPVGATGAIVHFVNTGATGGYGLRKKGSTDDRKEGDLLSHPGSIHQWTIVGVNVDGFFQAYVKTGLEKIYLTGYTTSGITMLTNGVDKLPAGRDAWTNIDCSSEAPEAIGLIFEIQNSGSFGFEENMGFRQSGSTDDRHGGISGPGHRWAIIGCNSSQVAQVYLETGGPWTLHLIGYITGGITFNTNADDITPTADTFWHDIGLSVLAPGAGMVIVEVSGPQALGIGSDGSYAIRKNGGSGAGISEFDAGDHVWAIVPCDSTQIIEGRLNSSSSLNFHLVGYSGATVYPSDPSSRITELIIRYTDQDVEHRFTEEILLGGATQQSLEVLSNEPPTPPEMTPEPDGVDTSLMEHLRDLMIAAGLLPPDTITAVPVFVGWDPDTGKEIWLLPGGTTELRDPEEDRPGAGGGGGPSFPI